MVKLIDMLICYKYAKNVKHVLILTLITLSMMFSNFCLKQKDNLDAWHCLLGKYSLLILFAPLSPSSEAEYKTALANSNFSNYL